MVVAAVMAAVALVAAIAFAVVRHRQRRAFRAMLTYKELLQDVPEYAIGGEEDEEEEEEEALRFLAAATH